MPTCQTADGLIYNSLKNRCRQILYRCTLVDKRLYICFCKYSAPGCNRIYNCVVFCCLVQSICISVEENCHLVDKGSRSSRACAVHSLFDSAAEESNFCIFPAQFDYNISLGDKFLHRQGTGYNLLFKFCFYCICQSKASRTGYDSSDLYIPHFSHHFTKQLFYLAENAGHMPFVSPVYYFIIFIYKDQLYRG